ncbi:DUF6544 family protein [Pseudonocardia sp. NPDC049154]|uniref:DUF6544 family protein n=1 Tax=Pseudonocardia sp. NPDC049154 TaxID=3155501 RepID=UPI0033EEE1B7
MALRRLDRAVRALALPWDPAERPAVTAADLAGLPEPAQRYLRAMGVPGRPRPRSFRVRLRARFRVRRTGGRLPCVAWQYNLADPVARVFVMRLRVAGVVPMLGMDTYVGGHGRMRGTLLGLVPVADGRGPEFDLGELATWVDDACLLAPAMLLTPAATWSPVDDSSFDVTVVDSGLTVTVRLTVDQLGRLVDVSTTDRYLALPSGPVRARWTTPVDGWECVAGHLLPTRARAVWHLDDGDFCYVDGRFEQLQLDVRPR